jgi:hypothetical protein
MGGTHVPPARVDWGWTPSLAALRAAPRFARAGHHHHASLLTQQQSRLTASGYGQQLSRAAGRGGAHGVGPNLGPCCAGSFPRRPVRGKGGPGGARGLRRGGGGSAARSRRARPSRISWPSRPSRYAPHGSARAIVRQCVRVRKAQRGASGWPVRGFPFSCPPLQEGVAARAVRRRWRYRHRAATETGTGAEPRRRESRPSRPERCARGTRIDWSR